jgi:putative hydrolase of the HAD superfamily
MECRKLKVIAFDADHTLYEIETKEAYEKMFAYLSEVIGIEKAKIEEVFRSELEKLLSSANAKDPEKRRREYVILKTAEVLGVSIEKKEIENSLEIFWNSVLESLTPKEGVVEFLEYFKDRIIMGVFTDEFREIVTRKLHKAFGEWQNYFRFLITPEDTGEMKPSLNYYTKILELTKERPESILVVGDSWERDLKLAKEIGMKTALVSEKYQGMPDFFVKDFHELKKILQG